MEKLEISKESEIVETKKNNLISKISTSFETNQKENGSETDQKENKLKKSISASLNKKTPVVFLDEMYTKKSAAIASVPLDIKFGLSTDEEETGQAEKPDGQKTNNSDTDQTILVKKKSKFKRNKSTRTASKQLDRIQNNYSSDSSLNPSSSCDETETSNIKNLKKKKSLRKKLTESASESGVNSQDTEQSSSGLSYQGYYAQPYLNQYQPYIIYQIDPNTNLPVALIPINAYNIPAPNASNPINPDTTNPMNNLNQYYTAMDINAYNYQMANYQYMQQLGLNYQPNIGPMTYSVYAPQTGSVESANQANVQTENQAQNSPNQQNSHHVPLNYNYNHYPGNYASYPSFSNVNYNFNTNNNYMQKSSSFSMPNNHSGTNVNQNSKKEHHSNENSNLSNNNVPTSNAKFNDKSPRYPK